jgi:hypothetical protein
VKRALRLGARLQYVPEVVQYHYVDVYRLTLSYLFRKAFVRSASTVRLADDQEYSGVPPFIYRKIASYLLSAVFVLSWKKRRFYMVRLAAASGEMRGYLHRRSERLQDASTTDAENK